MQHGCSWWISPFIPMVSLFGGMLWMMPGEAAEPALDKDAYIRCYQDFIKPFQKSRFAYTSDWSRKTREETYSFKETGSVSIDASRSTFLRHQAVAMSRNGSDYHNYGVTDVLLKHTRLVYMSSRSLDTPPESLDEFAVTINNHLDATAFKNEMASFCLGPLLGRITGHRSIDFSTEIENTSTENTTISKDLVDGCRQIEFRNDDLKLVLFVQEDIMRPAKLTWEVVDQEKVSHGMVTSGSLEIDSFQIVDGVSVPERLSISFVEAGGVIDTAELPEEAAVPRDQRFYEAPSTDVSSAFSLSELTLGEDVDGATFELRRPIPDGVTLNLVGVNPTTTFFWRDGKIWQIAPEVSGNIGTKGFQWSVSAPTLVFLLVVMNGAAVATYFYMKRYRTL